MKPLPILTALTAFIISACSGNHLSGGVRTVSVAPAARKAPMVLAPTREAYFNQMAAEQSDWAVGAMRAAIQRELAAGGRFQVKAAGSADAEIALDTLRHGLIEVSADSYAVQVSGTATVTEGGKQKLTRELNGVSGDIRTMKDFEETANYREALQGVMNKVALELVTTL